MNAYINNITHERGDTFSCGVEAEGLGQDLETIYFTCRENLNDNSKILFQKKLNNGITLVNYDQEKDIRQYAVRIAPEDTANIQSGNYYYDLQIGVNSDIFTIMKGLFVIEQDCTREGESNE